MSQGTITQPPPRQFEQPTAPTPTPQPEPTPTPQPGTLIFDSARDTKLHLGASGTLPATTLMECRASGDPKIRINADGTFSLVSGTGTADNHSIKVRSRHNEGGAEENRFGGVGTHISRSQVGMKIEKFHNEHEQGTEKSLPKSIATGQFIKVRYTCKDASNGIYELTELDYNDGKGYIKVLERTSSTVAAAKNKASFDQKSYLWLRLNNSDHGRIYVYKNNYNCRLEEEFKFDSGNSITFKYVRLYSI